MSATVPSVLLSSTYYDLGQVRSDVVDFLESQLGYHALAFEYSSFPIDPDISAIDNCRQRVEKQADVLVLLIGGRYGYTEPASGKSVTNLEYLSARVKGIPTYVFVDKRVNSLYDLWRKHPTNDYTGSVDNPKIFEFLREVREVHKVWTSPFERAQDVVESLRQQFAFLMLSLASYRARTQRTEANVELAGLAGRAFRLGLEHPPAWEYQLFSQLLGEELQKHSDRRRDYEIGFCLGTGTSVGPPNFGWAHQKMEELARAAKQFSSLINTVLPDAFGPPGQAGSVSKIRYAAARFAELYAFVLEWVQVVRRAQFDPVMAEVQEALSEFSRSFIENIELLDQTLRAELKDVELKIANGEKVVINLALKLELSGLGNFEAAVKLAMKRLALQRAFTTEIDL